MVRHSLLSLLALALVTFSEQSRADFGEIDIIVQESIQGHFARNKRRVDIDTLRYNGDPKMTGRVLAVKTSVWAEKGLTTPAWGWHNCTTKIEVKSRSSFVDLGSECLF